jgi:uncharacterized repeat protein (TIGR01451 family)
VNNINKKGQLSLWLTAVIIMIVSSLFMLSGKNVQAVEPGVSAKDVRTSTDVIRAYFNWNNSWQTNNTIAIKSEINDADVTWIPLLFPYNRSLDIKYTFNLTAGDTKPQINSSAFTYALQTSITESSWPEFYGVDPTINYEYTNPSYWQGIPANNKGRFTSTMTNWDEGIVHWSGWPASDRKSSAYVMYPKGKTTAERLIYVFDDLVPNETSLRMTTNVNINYGSFAKIPNVSFDVHGVGWEIEVPQLVKGVFKDVDDPQGPSLAAEEVAGYSGKIGDSVTLKNKDIAGYHFVGSQIVTGSKVNKLFSSKIHTPENYPYDNSNFSVAAQTSDTSWTTSLDTQQRGIIWWYKKAEPLPEIKKEADKPEVSVGQAITYKLTVSNTGNGPLTQPLISDRLPKDSVTKPVDITLELANGTKRKLLEGKGNANAQGEYYEYFLPAENPAAENLLQIHLGDVLKVNEIKNITYTITLIKGVNGETKVNTATLTGVNTTAQPSASASILVNNGTLKLSVPDTVTFGEAKLPKSIGTNLQRNSGFQISVIDSRVQKDDFYVTAIESQAFINKNTGASLTAPLIFKEVNNVERKISASDSAIVFQPNVKKQNGTVNYQSAWAADQGLMFKVPTTAQLGTYNGEITWNLLTAP